MIETDCTGTASPLRADQGLAQRYLDTAEVILLGLDLESRITLANRYACDVLGCSVASEIDRGTSIHVHFPRADPISRRAVALD